MVSSFTQFAVVLPIMGHRSPVPKLFSQSHKPAHHFGRQLPQVLLDFLGNSYLVSYDSLFHYLV